MKTADKADNGMRAEHRCMDITGLWCHEGNEVRFQTWGFEKCSKRNSRVEVIPPWRNPDSLLSLPDFSARLLFLPFAYFSFPLFDMLCLCPNLTQLNPVSFFSSPLSLLDPPPSCAPWPVPHPLQFSFFTTRLKLSPWKAFRMAYAMLPRYLCTLMQVFRRLKEECVYCAISHFHGSWSQSRADFW